MALRKARRLSEKTIMVCNTQCAKKPPDLIALVPQCLCVLILRVPFAGHYVEELETLGDLGAAVGRAWGRAH